MAKKKTAKPSATDESSIPTHPLGTPNAPVIEPDTPPPGPDGDVRPSLTRGRREPVILPRSRITAPLAEILKNKSNTGPQGTRGAELGTENPSQPQGIPVIIEINLNYAGNSTGAYERVKKLIPMAIAKTGGSTTTEYPNQNNTSFTKTYLFACLSSESIQWLLKLDATPTEDDSSAPNAILRIWPDYQIDHLIFKSARTVKADAARNTFSADGDGIVWAVIDSGIDGTHPHFIKNKNLDPVDPVTKVVLHRDFTVNNPDDGTGNPLSDGLGHGTMVAGIIAGELAAKTDGDGVPAVKIKYATKVHDASDEIGTIDKIAGMAPKTKLVSLRVLDDRGAGNASRVIDAINYIQMINSSGRLLKIHGVNISLGYAFDPQWFACGQSPLCVEVDRLVKSGVVVIVASGNSGFAVFKPLQSEVNTAGSLITINDPGNAQQAITVGSTHRDSPHVYGVSYFSSKGPTGDGRAKPDLIAPGEKIISCRSSQLASHEDPEVNYTEDSGTSFSAPHVSGVIAGFLSIRNEYIGRPDEVKTVFLNTATDLGRVAEFQGRGLVDLMRAIQSV